MKKILLSFLTITAFSFCATAQITDLPVTATPTSISSGQSSTISTTGSQDGVSYSLRNSINTVIDGPTAGNGSNLSFNTGVLTATETFNVYANTTNSVGLYMNGSDDYLSIPMSTSFDYSAGFSYEAWIKTPTPSSINSYHPILFIGSSAISDIEVYLRSGDLSVVYDRGKAGVNSRTYPAPPNNTWFHFAITFDGSITKVYYNGVLQVNQTGSLSGSMTRSAGTEVNIGGIIYAGFPATPSYNKYTEGTFDDIRLWNTERTITEISNNKSVCLVGNEIGLEALYKLNDSNGSTAIDAVGNNNATLTNMDTTTSWSVVGSTLVPCGLNLNMQMTQTATVTVGGVGINEHSNKSQIAVYPNPATFQLTLNTTDKIEWITILDVTGKTIRTITSSSNTIDVSELVKGIYFLQIQTDKGIANSKFIKE